MRHQDTDGHYGLKVQGAGHSGAIGRSLRRFMILTLGSVMLVLFFSSSGSDFISV
jgi:hypothetical protein